MSKGVLRLPEELKEYLSYDKDTGLLTWVKSPSRSMPAGKLAGCLDDEGYKLVRFKGKNYRYARVCYYLYYGSQPAGVVDHINRDRQDNRIDNLRLVTTSQNRTNSEGFGRSEYRGVNYRSDRDSWIAFCGGSYLGSSKDAKEAALMYNYKAVEMYGDYAYVNQVFKDISIEALKREYQK